MDDEVSAIRALKNDLAALIAELALVDALPMDQAAKSLQACEQRFSDLPQRIQAAVVSGNCVFVERQQAGEWQYLLQHGDFIVCDRIPAYMRDAILKPVAHRLTPLSDGTEVIWYNMA